MRTKFQLWQVSRNAGFDGVNLTFRAVMDCKENKSFAKYVPSGEIKLCVTNPAIASSFEPGQEYFIDFELIAPKQEIEEFELNESVS
jgi:hypothetical protein